MLFAVLNLKLNGSLIEVESLSKDLLQIGIGFGTLSKICIKIKVDYKAKATTELSPLCIGEAPS